MSRLSFVRLWKQSWRNAASLAKPASNSPALKVTQNSKIPGRKALFECLSQSVVFKPKVVSIAPKTGSEEIQDALSFWRSLFSPTAKEMLGASYETAIDHAIQCNDVELAKAAADEARELSLPASHLYDRVVQAYCRLDGRVEMASTVFGLMRTNGMSLTDETWFGLAVAQSRKGWCREAFETCKTMKRAGIKPSRFVYNQVLASALSLGNCTERFELAQSIVQLFLSDWKKPDLDCFHALLAHASSQEELERILADMNSADVNALPKTWEIIIEAGLQCGPVAVNRWGLSIPSRETVKWLLKILSGKKSFKVEGIDSVACDRLLKACLLCGSLSAGMQVFHLMRRSYSIIPTPKGYGTLLRLATEKGKDIGLVHYLWQDILDVYDGFPPEWAYSSMLEPMAKFQGTQGVFYMRNLMLTQAGSSSHHWAFSPNVYHALIRSSCTAKDSSLAWQYYGEMKEFHQPVEETFAALLLTIKSRYDFEDHAMRLLGEMAKHGVSKSGLLRRPFMLMCSRIRLGSGGSMNHAKGFDQLTSSNLIQILSEMEPEASAKRASGLLCSAVVNVILRTVQNPGNTHVEKTIADDLDRIYI
eukprot:m.184746 g.184746  ORF g.184746 m.184746 type:complete len:590 (+) comp39333_c0_seq4:384-2153(+)